LIKQIRAKLGSTDNCANPAPCAQSTTKGQGLPRPKFIIAVEEVDKPDVEMVTPSTTENLDKSDDEKSPSGHLLDLNLGKRKYSSVTANDEKQMPSFSYSRSEPAKV